MKQIFAFDLIYQNDTYNLQNIWFEDFNYLNKKAHFAVSKTNWINEDLKLFWLLTIFEFIMKPKANNCKHLLIVNGHSSHFSTQFINYCDKYNILFIISFPHLMY